MKDLSRLLNLKKETEQAGARMKGDRHRFARIKGAEAPRTVTAFNLFQTPEALADRMAEMLPELSRDAVILEPSAGLGRLYSAVRRSGFEGRMELVENSPDCMGELYDLTDGNNVGLNQKDFLAFACPLVDAVIMNPPFKKGLDIKHIMRAVGLVKPGGMVVALCYNGTRQNQKLKPLVDTWEVLPAGTFKEAGTMAEVVLLTITNRTERIN